MTSNNIPNAPLDGTLYFAEGVSLAIHTILCGLHFIDTPFTENSRANHRE